MRMRTEPLGDGDSGDIPGDIEEQMPLGDAGYHCIHQAGRGDNLLEGV